MCSRTSGARYFASCSSVPISKRSPCTGDSPNATPISKEALTRGDIDIGEGTPVETEERTLKCTWPVTFERSYTQWANRQALAQLGKAGFRLAALLREIFEPR